MSGGWEGALETVVGRMGHDRYRWLCSDANPDDEARAAYRRLMVFLVSEDETDIERAARLSAENPPARNTGVGGCGPCN